MRYEDSAAKAFRKLDKENQRRIAVYMRDVCALEHPETRGKPMTANYAGYWRYRVGNYRLICRFFGVKCAFASSSLVIDQASMTKFTRTSIAL